MDLNKFKRFKRSGGYRRRVHKKLVEMKTGSMSNCGLVLSEDKSDAGAKSGGSAHRETELDVDHVDNEDYCASDINQNDSSDSENSDNELMDYDLNNAMKESIKQWALKNNISHSALTELSEIINQRIKNVLPKDARTLLQTNYKKIHITSVGTGYYWHNGLIDQLKRVLRCLHQVPNNTVSLNINVDGLPIYKSSRQQFWPILVSIAEIPKLSPLIVGIYVGNGKPSHLDDYLNSVVTELKELENGLVIDKNGAEVTITVKIRAFICDSPARAFLKGVSNFNSKHGCLKCTVVGEYSHVSRTVTFLRHNCLKRNDEDFRAKKYGDHHKEDSPLLKLNIDMIEDFVVADSLHLIDLGLMKRLLMGWRDGNFGKYITKWCARDIEKVNSFLRECKMPKEIHRSVRTVDVLAHWKGSEYRCFFYYLSIIILKDVLKPDPYNHFLHLFCAVTICSNKDHFQFLRIAEKMIDIFIEHFKRYYGKDYISSNIHNLTHIVEEVRKNGILQSFSAYPFENKLYTIKNMLRHGNKPLQQVARRINERFDADIQNLNEGEQVYPFVKNYERKGELKNVLHFESYILNTQKENKWFLSDQNDVVEVNSIIIKSGDERNKILLNGYRIVNTYDVFDEPLKSSYLNIYKCHCNDLTKIEAVYAVTNIKCKLVCVKYYSELFFIPLLHTL